MSQLRAFRFDVFEEVDGSAIVVATTASKARYLLYLHCQELGFRDSLTGKRWPALTDLRPRRAPDFDELAGRQPRATHWSLPYALRERDRLATA